MGQMITGSIDLNKINKAKAKPHGNGALYYPITIFINDEPDQYKNDVSICESQTKEERENKEKKKYIGNGRVYKKDGYVKEEPKAERFEVSPEQVKVSNSSDDSLPF